ncbi:UV DNA damage repair endonuclease UvsE [Bacillus sp. Marseille-P3661]|uniref:UV DNA damage repair endonuclease UvsE n=1 Tax=Bacillus sp. Marseille-P3661 TaxID=1936234 RepID=UPI000C821F09|nr:UV DNA damage repair endonuclease UvsE [Bacillus sp. Marseille-P3661]
MIIRFGYVSQALALWECSPSKALTFKSWKQLKKENREEKLKEVCFLNIMHTKRIIHYNIAHDIPLYRFSSSMIPLATHPEVRFDFQKYFQSELIELGALVKTHRIRTSFHPNQFTLFTSEEERISKNAVVDMEYHYNLLQAMGLEQEALINIHVGGAYGDKKSAVKRFHENLKMLPEPIKKRMTLENDDKTYNAEEVLAICQKENIPLIFDYHHHLANQCDNELESMLPAIFDTWGVMRLRPKVHLSSPKSDKDFRHHADHVDVDFILPFIEMTKKLKLDFDVMVEAKKKDQALLKLIEDLCSIRGIKRIGGAVIEIK